MDELTPRHFRVLAATAAGGITHSEDGKESLGAFMPVAVGARAGMPPEIVQQCLLNLAGAGLVDTANVFGGTAYPVTELGRAVVQAAEVSRSD